jgi:hypothetical protein
MAMNHFITIGGLLSTLGIGLGILCALLGGLILFAEGMSDAPDTNGRGGFSGCGFIVVGLVLFAASVAWLVH